MLKSSVRRFAVVAILVGTPIFLFRVKFWTLVTASLQLTVGF